MLANLIGNGIRHTPDGGTVAIVKGIVEAHAGAVSVANIAEPASGCRFVVRLPA